MIASQYMTYEEVARELDLSIDRVSHLVGEGKLHSTKSKQIGRKGATKYISSKEVETYKQRKLTGSIVSASNGHVPATSNAGLDWYTTKILPLAHQAIAANEQASAKNKEIVQIVADNARAIAIEASREHLLVEVRQQLIDAGISPELATIAAGRGGNAAVDMFRDDLDIETALSKFLPGVDERKAAINMFAEMEKADYERQRAVLAEPQPA